MSQYPRVVLSTITIAWDRHADGTLINRVVKAGTVVDIPPGSALERCYGQGNLSPVIPASDSRRSPEGGADSLSRAAMAN